MMTARFAFRVGLAAIAVALLAPSAADARGLLLITHGNTIHPVGEFTPEHRAQAKAMKVGFKNDYVGVFWINLWTWGGTFCVYSPEGYEPIGRPTAARLLGRPESEVRAPFLYRFPLGLVILGVLAALLAFLPPLAFVLERIDKATVSRLLTEPPYQRALEIASKPQTVKAPETAAASGVEPTEAPEAKAAFDAGVRYLTDSGVPPEKARINLRLILRHSARKPADA